MFPFLLRKLGSFFFFDLFVFNNFQDIAYPMLITCGCARVDVRERFSIYFYNIFYKIIWLKDTDQV